MGMQGIGVFLATLGTRFNTQLGVDEKPARRLSEIRLIYCGCAGFGQILRSFSLNKPTIRFKRSKNLTQTDTAS